MNSDRRQVVVVEAGSPQLGLGQVESERFDKMQFASSGGDHPDRVAGVGCDPRRVEQQPKHSTMMASAGPTVQLSRECAWAIGHLLAWHKTACRRGYELCLFSKNCGITCTWLAYSTNCQA